MKSKFSDEFFKEVLDAEIIPLAPLLYGTVAWALQWYIDAMNGTGGKRAVKPLGGSHEYTLIRLQRQTIGAKDSRNLTEEDIIAHCEERINSVCAATINQDITYLHGALKYVRAAER